MYSMLFFLNMQYLMKLGKICKEMHVYAFCIFAFLVITNFFYCQYYHIMGNILYFKIDCCITPTYYSAYRMVFGDVLLLMFMRLLGTNYNFFCHFVCQHTTCLNLACYYIKIVSEIIRSTNELCDTYLNYFGFIFLRREIPNWFQTYYGGKNC